MGQTISSGFDLIGKGISSVWNAGKNAFNTVIDNTVGRIPVVGDVVKGALQLNPVTMTMRAIDTAINAGGQILDGNWKGAAQTALGAVSDHLAGADAFDNIPGVGIGKTIGSFFIPGVKTSQWLGQVGGSIAVNLAQGALADNPQQQGGASGDGTIYLDPSLQYGGLSQQEWQQLMAYINQGPEKILNTIPGFTPDGTPIPQNDFGFDQDGPMAPQGGPVEPQETSAPASYGMVYDQNVYGGGGMSIVPAPSGPFGVMH